MRIHITLPDTGSLFTPDELEAAKAGIARLMSAQFPQHEFVVIQAEADSSEEAGTVAIGIAADLAFASQFSDAEHQEIMAALRSILEAEREL